MIKNFGVRWRGYTKQEKILLPIIHCLLIFFAVWVLLPVVCVFLNSFKLVTEYNIDTLGFPKKLRFANYLDALKMEYRNTTVVGMFINSIIFTITFSFANVFSSCMAAYVLSKYNFRGRKIIYSLAIIVQILPVFGTAGAGYLLASRLGLTDNIWLLWITASSGFDYTFLIIYSYFTNVSWNYAEAAFIDGAGNFYVFTRIMLPMVSPAILTMGLSVVISLWGDYLTPMLYLQNTPTLAAGLFNLKSLASYTEGGITAYFAALIIAMIPLIILFALTQKKLFSIQMEGGIKG